MKKFNLKCTAACFLTAVLALNFAATLSASNYRNSNQYIAADQDEYDYNKSNKSDAELTKQIRHKIGSGWFSKGYEQVEVQVNNGNVTLSGSVRTNDDKEKVEKEVRNIIGVKTLTSQLEVREPNADDNKRAFPQDTYTTAADDQLNKKIRDKVSYGWLWNSYEDVTLNTSNGVVTLEGRVGSIADQQKLMTEIQKINGVKIVKSNLKIKNNK